MLQEKNYQFHLKIKSGSVGKYCILTGDPARCESIAAQLDSPCHVAYNREYNIWNGYIDGTLVTVCSTGIGGPSSAIAVEELAACGTNTFIRVGTCGGISTDVRAGDIVIASGAVRQDGTSHEYAPPEFPAVSDTDVLFALCEAAKESGCSYHKGVVQSKDSFYGQHSPDRMPTSYALNEKWQAWKRLGVLASEMESSTIFTVGASLGIRSGALFMCIWNQERYAAGLDTDEDEYTDTLPAIKIAVEAIRKIIERDNATFQA